MEQREIRGNELGKVVSGVDLQQQQFGSSTAQSLHTEHHSVRAVTTNKKSTRTHKITSSSSNPQSPNITTESTSTMLRDRTDSASHRFQAQQQVASVNNSDLFGRARSSGAQIEFDQTAAKSIEIQQEEESRVRHRESFSSTTTLRSAGELGAMGQNAAAAAAISQRMSAAHEARASSCVSATHNATHTNNGAMSSSSASSSTSHTLSSQRHFEATSAASFRAGLHAQRGTAAFAASPDLSLFSSPGVLSLVREIGSEFAELENVMSASGFGANRRELAGASASVPLGVMNVNRQPVSLLSGSRFAQPQDGQNALTYNEPAQAGDKIRELLSRAEQCHSGASPTGVALSEHALAPPAAAAVANTDALPCDAISAPMQRENKAALESIDRIDQRMVDVCKALAECQATSGVIEMLKVILTMIEKAWSVPRCGDTVGFRLCTSLRVAGGLDTILRIMCEASEAKNDAPAQPDTSSGSAQTHSQQPPKDDSSLVGRSLAAQTGSNTHPRTSKQTPALLRSTQSANPLKLNLAKIGDQNNAPAKDSDSDIMTSDLGVDSTSVESLAYANALSTPPAASASGDPNKRVEDLSALKDELVMLCARILSQSLSSDNRDYLVHTAQLEPVTKLACSYATMRAGRSQRILRRSRTLARQASRARMPMVASDDATSEQRSSSAGDARAAAAPDKPVEAEQIASGGADAHSSVGTEILQHLFKHSEETCAQICALGGLQAILYGCRSSNVDTLRHCASALVNLALYGGREGQQTMIEQKAHVWLFPLAFHKDDNIQYYACLAIAVLVANQEIEADVLKSSTLDLVEPFVTTHEPRKFAESTTAHIHGQSAAWLAKLVPLLRSKREQARNLACFHFAMEAYIKSIQTQAHVFRDIGAIGPLRRCGSSPLALESKFACQALRSIGEPEPHRLSQQVPLWTCEDVAEWVEQAGFAAHKDAFLTSGVDGDLLLQLDEESLRDDIQIKNGIQRRRFLRELASLKRITDYSSLDKSGLCTLFGLSSSPNSASSSSTSPPAASATMAVAGIQPGARFAGSQSSGVVLATTRPNTAIDTHIGADVFTQYAYTMLRMGVTPSTLRVLDTEQLMRECRVSNSVHQTQLALAIRAVQERQAALEDAVQQVAASQAADGSQHIDTHKTLDVFVSYRRSTGSQLASLLKVHLQLRGFSVFIDVERLEAGKFDNNLLESIKAARNFILVLSPNALDRCIGDQDCKDWVHKEIVAALASQCNIIPILDNFQWPDADQLPEDMRSIAHYNGVPWIHDYQDACVDKIERFIRGELSNGLTSNYHMGSLSSSCCSTTNSTLVSSNRDATSRLASGGYAVSSPMIATPSISTAGQSIYASRAPSSSALLDSDHHPLAFAASLSSQQQVQS